MDQRDFIVYRPLTKKIFFETALAIEITTVRIINTTFSQTKFLLRLKLESMGKI